MIKRVNKSGVEVRMRRGHPKIGWREGVSTLSGGYRCFMAFKNWLVPFYAMSAALSDKL